MMLMRVAVLEYTEIEASVEEGRGKEEKELERACMNPPLRTFSM